MLAIVRGVKQTDWIKLELDFIGLIKIILKPINYPLEMDKKSNPFSSIQ